MDHTRAIAVMDMEKSFPTISKMRFSIVHLLILTTGFAFFFVVLFYENEWLLATYATLVTGIVLHEFVAAICARGERQYFSLGFVCCFPLYYITMYAYAVTLPYLITAKIYELLQASGAEVPTEGHFLGVMASFWILLTSFCMGRFGLCWYRRTQEEKALVDSGDGLPSGG